MDQLSDGVQLSSSYKKGPLAAGERSKIELLKTLQNWSERNSKNGAWHRKHQPLGQVSILKCAFLVCDVLYVACTRGQGLSMVPTVLLFEVGGLHWLWLAQLESNVFGQE